MKNGNEYSGCACSSRFSFKVSIFSSNEALMMTFGHGRLLPVFTFNKGLPLWATYPTDLLPYDDTIITVILCY